MAVVADPVAVVEVLDVIAFVPAVIVAVDVIDVAVAAAAFEKNNRECGLTPEEIKNGPHKSCCFDVCFAPRLTRRKRCRESMK